MKTISIEELCQALKKANIESHRLICDLEQGKKKFEMSIPVQRTDSDMLLQDSIDLSEQLVDRLVPILDENKRLREALEFYAEPSSWLLTSANELTTICDDDMQEADEPNPWGCKGTYIGGKRARQALKERI